MLGGFKVVLSSLANHLHAWLGQIQIKAQIVLLNCLGAFFLIALLEYSNGSESYSCKRSTSICNSDFRTALLNIQNIYFNQGRTFMPVHFVPALSESILSLKTKTVKS